MISLGILEEPTLTPCHHAFCKNCLDRMLRVAQKTDAPCPVCKMRVTRRTVVSATHLGELVEAFHELAREYHQNSGKQWDDSDEKENRASLGSGTPTTQEIEQLKMADARIDKELAEIEVLIEEKRVPKLQGYKSMPPECDTQALLDEIQFPSSPDDLFLRTSTQQLFSPNPIVLCTSLVRNNFLRTINEFAEQFRIKISTVYESEVTHLVTFSKKRVAKRTLKYLRGILNGSWVVSSDWVDSCLREGRIVDEGAFEVTGDEYYPDEDGPRRGRISKSQNESPLLTGHSFYLYGAFAAPNKEELYILILESGGELLSNVEDLARKKHGKVMVLCDPKEQADFEKDAGIISKFKPLISSMWLLDCISAFQIVDTTPHIVL